MKVKLRTIYASPQRIAFPGTIIDVPDGEAEALVDGNYAELVDDHTPENRETTARRGAPERAVRKAPESRE